MKQGRHASAQKRARQALKREARNRSAIAAMRTAIKNARLKPDTAFKTAVSVIAKTASKGAIHWKTAARYTSRLARAASKQAL